LSIGYDNICSSVQDHRQKFSVFKFKYGFWRTNESNGINKKEAWSIWRKEILKKRSFVDKRSRRSWRHQKYSHHQKLITRSWKNEEFQVLFKWWFNHAYHCKRLEECSNGYHCYDSLILTSEKTDTCVPVPVFLLFLLR